VNTKDGNRKLVKPNMLYSDRSGLSPDEKYVLFYDYDEKAYFSYNINIGKTINITKDIPFPIYGQTPAGTTLPHPYSSLPDTWFHNGKSLIVYDQYDLWKIDPTGKELPFCLTQGYGRKNEIIFRLPPDTKFSKTNVLLTAFRTSDKSSGFYRMDLSKKSSPELLSMQPCSYAWGDIESMNDTWQPLKAENSNTYLLLKRTASEAPNFVITNDFKHFRQLSDVQPQKNYNWLTAELHTWQDCNGERLQGILYKPENFDSQKRYPVIFNFYEEKSFGLYNYLIPKATGDHINIPHFVSNDYLVFVPDITYKKGDPAKSVCDAIVSATNYISKMPFVDSSKFGLQGHSFAGYEVNVLVSKTFRFAAAAEAAGTSDLVSAYNSLKGASFSNQFAGETGQYRIGATLWQNRDAYIKNSPIFYADQVQTPLLMQNNKKDYTVKFEQGVEFFTALRRLNKKVWMLQYDGQSHQMDGSSAKDYTVRLMQFFDHYLKSAPAPIWMTQGVPARLKGVITGYDLDPSGNCGKDCKVCKMWNEKMKKDSAGTMNEIREKAKSEHWMDGGGN
jgi:dipeptidyl aminopeptidase/acylaminoacyl peptidase